MVLADDLVLLHLNAAAERFLGVTHATGRNLGDFLKPSGLEFDGNTLEQAIDQTSARTGAAQFRLMVRKNAGDAERILFLCRLPVSASRAVWSAAVEGSVAREDLVELRAKAREVAHSLNNVVMTAVGNVSLARLYAAQPPESTKHLDSAERNLLQVREITRELQIIAKKDIPLA